MLRQFSSPVVAAAALAVAAAGLLHAAPDVAAGASPAGTDPALRERVILVKPVIVHDDDGTHPARHALPKAALDAAFSRAGAEVIFLEPIPWHNGPARRGESTPAEIAKQGRASGVIAADRRVITIMFVSGVDGQAGPTAAGRADGQVCFVALGPAGETPPPATDDALAVERALLRCFEPPQAADSSQQANEAARDQADGAADDESATRASGLALPRVHCHPAAESRELLADESWFAFHATSTPDAARFALGLAPDAPVPADPAERAKFSRERHAATAVDFTASERAALERAVAALRRELGTDWPLVSRLPWHFVKVKSGFCNDLPHTRGMATVLSQAALRQLLDEPEMARFLLFHEKIHVVQRLNPGRFSALFQAYGYHPVRLAAGEAARLNLLVNPDAPVHDHAITVDDRTVLIAPVFVREGDRIGFAENYFLLKPGDGGVFLIDGEFPAAPVEQWLDRFVIRSGYDHPTETFAYHCNLLLDLRQRKELAQANDHPMLRATIEAAPAIFRLSGE
jgi:hypothetical protein